jgi:hypothetical protein
VSPSSTAQLVRLPRLEGDGPHAVSVGGFDLVVVRAGGNYRAFDGPDRGVSYPVAEAEGTLWVELPVSAGRATTRCQ